ncbi:hypothetical protein M2281_000166 [Mesorhizobium soli]|uniref:class I SAM-dependent methyltransferase n=1 Tax=Pseudaminobacter soli (ex Li et al. 2025) TaxID=1295366 RepID=UPI002472F9E0|nr:class I SAM-dependent methyltransferase [Mesorhizobium soli]MDH6229594.1 hypothetical protein [Mesorhizobium soli]
MGFLRNFRIKIGLKKAPESRPTYIRPPNIHAPVDVGEVVGGKFDRRPDITRLLPMGGIGIELGVAKGWFSHQILANSRLDHLFSVDRWAGDRGHDVSEYKDALRLLLPYKERSTCLRMLFSEALDLFPDGYFDFIYIDGYAHTGQEGGETLKSWWPKLKVGGLFAGDDYGPDWPLVMQEVDSFAFEHGLECMTLTPKVVESELSHYPSWLAFKR